MANTPGYIQFDYSSKCVSLNGFASDNGVRTLTWDCINQDNQKWSIVNGDSVGFRCKFLGTGIPSKIIPFPDLRAFGAFNLIVP